MTGLIEFIRARVAEDRATAQQATSMGPHHAPLTEWEYVESQWGTWSVRTAEKTGVPGYEAPHDITRDSEGLSDSVDADAGPHIARHDPARVLTQCGAFDRILDLFPNADWADGRWNEAGAQTLAALALLWADHPDYRQEWRP